MPYKIIDVDNGFKVMRKGSRPPRYYSKKPLTKKMATRQMRALYAAENQKGSAFAVENPDGSLNMAYTEQELFDMEVNKEIERLYENDELIDRLVAQATRRGLQGNDLDDFMGYEVARLATMRVQNRQQQTGLGLNKKTQKGGCMSKDTKLKTLYRVASQMFI